MRKFRILSHSLVCLLPCVFGFAFSGFAHADPLPSPKLTASVMKKSEIPLRVLKDIRRVHPGMTRADLDWLFIPDGGLITYTPRSYIYRYAGVGIALLDPSCKPVLDKITHKPVMLDQEIMIDVKFSPATARDMRTEEKTGHQFASPDGSPDDVIVSVSDPYVGFEHDN